MKTLAIVVPAYNEEEVLTDTNDRLLGIIKSLIEQDKISHGSKLLYVDDGSTDNTWEMISKFHDEDPMVTGLKFSRNFGHQSALIAGMTEAIKFAKIVITIDADLQDDPDQISEMIDKNLAGAEIVYGVRNNRETDTWFKRTTAQGFYTILNLIGVKLVRNHADFRLMSKKAIQTFLSYGERNMFIRGIIPMLGYKTDKVYYKRTPRMAGESKYPLKKMLAFAWDGISSLSISPVRLILLLGVIADILGFSMLVYTTIVKALDLAVHGWSSLMISIWILGGLQMISLGVIGEYVGKVMLEVKDRPRYTIEKSLSHDQKHTEYPIS